MANIRTLSDYASAPGQSTGRAAGSSGSRADVSTTPLPRFFSSAGGIQDVNDSNSTAAGTCNRIMQQLFPGLAWKRAVVVLSAVQVVLYIITLCFGLSPNDFLAPTTRTLEMFGANIPELIREGEVYRLLLPLFLHLNFFHILMNLWVQLRVGILIETQYGWKRFLVVYLGVGVLANLISAAVLFCDQIKAGASTAVFALIGVQFAELALVWHMLQDRSDAILSIAVSLFFLFISSFGQHIDGVGHIAGICLGFGAGLALNENSESKPPWFDRALMLFKGVYFTVPLMSAISVWAIPRCT